MTDEQRRAVITGITGQDGSYLAELLLAKGYRVWGLVRRSSTPSTGRLAAVDDNADLRLAYGDLGDSSSLRSLINEADPHEVYNLAAQSDVKISFSTPEETGNSAAIGVTRVLEAIRSLGGKARFYQASSSEMYGKVLETPQTENTPFYPRSPYAVAKVYAYFITRNFREAYGLYAVNGILFNHESPRRGENFVTRKITKAVARITAGQQETVSLGNLEAHRDWGFAGDYVDAMWRMLQHDEARDFVVATGESHSVREFCELAFGHADLPLTWDGAGEAEVGRDADGVVRVDIDPAFYRPAEVDMLIGDATKARELLGWQPRTSFAELIAQMVDGDRDAITDRS
ncbi:MAG: GDP-mannose 4,6-dehydratase [Acidobacteriota bacterium]|nr:GDP-mannose 4,6-dehydratase [Acidobacteriota bacterium]